MSAVQHLEQQLEDMNVSIARRDKALKLAKNKDFRDLIMEEFCVQECARYAQASGDPSLDKEARADSLGMAQAAGHLRRWLQVVCQLGNTAEGTKRDLEEAIAEARAEEAE